MLPVSWCEKGRHLSATCQECANLPPFHNNFTSIKLNFLRRIDKKQLPDCAGSSSACKGRIVGLCNPLRNTAGGRKDEQAGNFFDRNRLDTAAPVKHWYAIYTKPRQEDHAAEHLRRQAFEVYLPRIKQVRRYRGRWRDTVEPLFPRYLFIRLDLGRENVAPIRSTRGVSRLVSFSGHPARVPDALIDALHHSADPDTGLHQLEESRFETGATVTIVDGPLVGLEAIFQAHDGEARCIILLDILGQRRQLRIDKDHLWPARHG
jgi:transcriptional antiterminator RfaH